MNETKRKYRKGCKSKLITFYKHEEDLLKFANSINFQKFVKGCIKFKLLEQKSFKVENPLNKED